MRLLNDIRCAYHRFGSVIPLTVLLLTLAMTGACYETVLEPVGLKDVDYDGSEDLEEGDDECTDGRVPCEGTCVDLMTDHDNCGDCGNPCGSGEICSSGTCRAECVDECETSGTSRCATSPPDYLEYCDDHDLDGCLEWGGPSPCPGGTSCSDGACSSGCVAECDVSGATQCTGGGLSYETCGEYDDDGCLEWGSEIPCVGLEQCISGACDVLCPEAAGEWEFGRGYSASDNPSGAWSFGYSQRLDAIDFTIGETYAYGDMQGWSGYQIVDGIQFPSVLQNVTAGTIEHDGASYEPGEIGLYAGNWALRGVARWTSPYSGDCDVDARFYSKGTGETYVSVTQGEEILFQSDLSLGDALYRDVLHVSPGSWIQFTVGELVMNSAEHEGAGLDVTIRKRSWTLFDDVVAGCNSIGRWSMGYASSLGTFTPFEEQGLRDDVNPYWSRSGPISPDGQQSYAWKNVSVSCIDSICSYEMALHPGCFDEVSRCGEEWAVVRWTSYFDGEISISGLFGAGGSAAPDLDIVQTVGGVPSILWHRENTNDVEVFDVSTPVQTGDAIDFVVGDAFVSGDTPIDVTIRRTDMET